MSTNTREEKWAEVEKRFEELGDKIAELQITRDVPELRRISRLKTRLEKPVSLYREWKRMGSDIEEAKALLAEQDDEELRQELASLQEQRIATEEALTDALLPRDENDDKDVIIEIRAGTGGDEASIFAGDLMRMYSRYADTQGWKVELMDASEGEVGGYKEVVLSIQGSSVYANLKHESGVHRVQRVPATESGGRIHTSTATIAVMPEAEEVDVEINNADLEIDTYRASGPGGQHMQKNETAVRITHKPSGLVVSSQSQRSQGQNKILALRVLRARLLERAEAEAHAEHAAIRREQVGTGDRGEKIRTYNVLQDRITDHRVKRDWHGITTILNGDIGDIVAALREMEREQLLAKVAAEAAS
jgi:peptide chain release factor 1